MFGASCEIWSGRREDLQNMNSDSIGCLMGVRALRCSLFFFSRHWASPTPDPQGLTWRDLGGGTPRNLVGRCFRVIYPIYLSYPTTRTSRDSTYPTQTSYLINYLLILPYL